MINNLSLFQLNPQKEIPVLVDDDLIMGERFLLYEQYRFM